MGGIMNSLSPTYFLCNSNIAIEKANMKILFSTAFHPSFCGYKHEIWIKHVNKHESSLDLFALMQLICTRNFTMKNEVLDIFYK